MDDNEKNFYNPVAPKEKLYVLEYLGKEKRPIVLQAPSGSTHKSHVMGSSRKEVRVQEAPGMTVNTGDTVSFMVIFDRNKYWFRGSVEVVSGYLIFGEDIEIRKIQRRENFRASVPGTILVELQMDIYGEQNFNKSFPILDISFGGCQFEVNGTSMPFVDGGLFQGSIESPRSSKPIPVRGVVRRVLKNTEHGFMRVGVQFDEHDRGVETPLMDLIMHCARESQKYEAL
tara:strand:- start:48863 stop:49549 length:687 start_codon:yes stop_codon:yes gene_type:complete